MPDRFPAAFADVSTATRRADPASFPGHALNLRSRLRVGAGVERRGARHGIAQAASPRSGALAYVERYTVLREIEGPEVLPHCAGNQRRRDENFSISSDAGPGLPMKADKPLPAHAMDPRLADEASDESFPATLVRRADRTGAWRPSSPALAKRRNARLYTRGSRGAVELRRRPRLPASRTCRLTRGRTRARRARRSKACSTRASRRSRAAARRIRRRPRRRRASRGGHPYPATDGAWDPAHEVFGNEEQAVVQRRLGREQRRDCAADRREAELPQRFDAAEVFGPIGNDRRRLRAYAASQRRIAPARPGGTSAAIRSASIRAISALIGKPPRSASRLSMSSRTGGIEADRGLVPGDLHRALDGRVIDLRHRLPFSHVLAVPLIDSVDPVTKPPSSEARKATPRAISTASPQPADRNAGDDLFEHVLAGTAATMSVSM